MPNHSNLRLGADGVGGGGEAAVVVPVAGDEPLFPPPPPLFSHGLTVNNTTHKMITTRIMMA